jgi:NAD(P)H-dependent FMN reductase
MSVPAYWGGPAGAIKNFIDVIGGPAYDAPAGSALPLQGKVIALLIVGADALSAYGALASMRLTLGSAGAWTAPRAQVIPNPREVRDAGRLLAALKGFAGYVASLAQAAAPVR